MNFLNLCDDIIGMIQVEVANHPKYRYKKVLEELVNGDWELNDLELDNLIDSPPYNYATYYHPDEGGWWCDDILGEFCGTNWIVEDY